jgi:hypothetical protein
MKECNDTKANPEYHDKYVPVDDIKSTHFWKKVNDIAIDMTESPDCRGCVCQYNRLEEARFTISTLYTKLFQSSFYCSQSLVFLQIL